MKRVIAAVLSLCLLLSLCACGRKKEEPADFRIAALKGPTAMGLVRLMDEAEKSDNQYRFTLAGNADEVTSLLTTGKLDAACIPANLAAILYQKTGGEIFTLAINTLGVLYVVENGDTVHSLSELAGKTIAASGKGSTPEFALRYLLKENGVDPDKDVTIEWKNEHSECVAAMAAGTVELALLPQPFVTVAQSKLTDLRIALDLTEEWDSLDTGATMLTGVVAVRKTFAQEHPEAIGTFLRDYEASVSWVNGHTAEAAERIGAYEIVDAAVAEKALPYCNIVCISGNEMKEKLSGYLEVLYEQSALSVGGKLPDDTFYYGA